MARWAWCDSVQALPSVIFLVYSLGLTQPACAGPSEPFSFLRTFENPVPSDERYGARVHLYGERAAVSSVNAVVNGSKAGKVYLYDCQSGALLHTFSNPHPEAGDLFGLSVLGLDNDLLLISSPSDNESETDAGKVYVYDSNTFAFIRSFSSPHPTPGGTFGQYMVERGNQVLIGAPGDLPPGAQGGAAYLFDMDSGDLLQTFKNPHPNPNDLFGYWTAWAGDRVVIGARLDDQSSELFSDTGTAYIFDAESGEKTYTLPNPTPGPSDQFGVTVAGVPGLAIIGSMNDDALGTDDGTVVIFDAETGVPIRTLNNPSPNSTSQFGSVEAADGLLIVGAPGGSSVSAEPGAAFLFDPFTGELLQSFVHPITPTRQTNGFGNRLDLNQNYILLGSPGDHRNGEQSGAAFLYQRTNLPPSVPSVRIEPENPFTFHDLICHASGSLDPEGQITTLSFEWYADGLLIPFDGLHSVTGPSLHHSYTRRDQVIQCRVRGFDGEVYGAPGVDSVLIANSPPSPPVVQLLPEHPSPADGLAVLIEDPYPVDADDDLILPLFEWYESPDGVNWTRRPELSGGLEPSYDRGEPEISGLYTQFAEHWRVDVTMVDFVQQAGPVKGASDPGAFSPTVSAAVLIFPDLNDDGENNADDLNLLLESWGKNRTQVEPAVRPFLFEPGASLSHTIGFDQLLQLGPLGWKNSLPDR